ncbi:hypothetical protein ACGFY6_25770 [Streptomyces sp. NPDC048387]|uniref:hypothetical protein n=1 Tax=Streptomyces sp. NPDC048387 TaxID=3365542 RepID=UPI00371D2332
MTPRPDLPPGTLEDLKAAVKIAKSARDKAVFEAEQQFWKRMGELSKNYFGAKQDVADTLGVTRDNVYKNVKKYTT